MGKTVYKFRKDRYEDDNFSYRDPKQKRREKLELKRIKDYNTEDYNSDFDSVENRNKKYRKVV